MIDVEEIDSWRHTFSLFDKRGKGNVECHEIGNMMRALGENPTQREIERITKEIDPNGEKTITFEEFVPLMYTQRTKSNSNNTYESFCESFRMFDRDGNGLVRVSEIRNILVNLGEQLSNEEMNILLDGMEDSNGMINYEEFVRKIMDG